MASYVERASLLVTPMLGPGEAIEGVEVVQIGKVSAKKQVVTSVVAGALTGGALIVALRPSAFFMVITNRNLHFISNTQGSMGKSIAWSVPRTAVKAGPLQNGLLTIKLDVEVDGLAYLFSWGKAQGKVARRVAAALHNE